MRDSFIYLGKSCFWYNVDIKAELVTDTNKYFDNLNRLPYIRSTSWWLFWSIFIVNVDAGGSRTAAKSKVKLIVIIVTDFQPLTIITKSSTLDVVTVLGPPLSGDFFIYNITSTWIVFHLDSIVKVYTKSWLRLPRSANTRHLYYPVIRLGIEV